MCQRNDSLKHWDFVLINNVIEESHGGFDGHRNIWCAIKKTSGTSATRNFIDGQMKKKGGTNTTRKFHEDAMSCHAHTNDVMCITFIGHHMLLMKSSPSIPKNINSAHKKVIRYHP